MRLIYNWYPLQWYTKIQKYKKDKTKQQQQQKKTTEIEVKITKNKKFQ